MAPILNTTIHSALPGKIYSVKPEEFDIAKQIYVDVIQRLMTEKAFLEAVEKTPLATLDAFSELSIAAAKAFMECATREDD